MSSTFGIDGLASGLDTSGIIKQLIAIERQPIVRFEQRISKNEAAIKSLNTFSGQFDTIKSLAAELSGSASTFIPRSASSSSDKVAATVSNSATAGSVSFSVTQLAGTHRLVSGGTATALTDTVATASSTVSITVDGVAHDIDTGDGSLQALIDNINATEGLGVTAQAANTGNGFKLQLTSTESGADGVFTVDTANLDGTFAAGMPVLSQGKDAKIMIGDVGQPGAYEVTSASNTFSDVVEGLSFTVSALSTDPVTITVSDDSAKLIDKVKKLVEHLNTTLTGLDRAIDSGSDGVQGTLANDPAMRSLRSRLIDTVTFAVSGSSFQSAGLIGLESTRDGKLTFDESKFTSALASDPDGLIAIFRSDDAASPGIAQRLETLAKEATNFTTGTFKTAISSRESSNRTLQDNIDRMDIRIELRRASLSRQFSALEVALSGMQAQGQWLAGSLASLPTIQPPS